MIEDKLQILMRLAHYKFLCISQMQTLGLTKSKKTIRKILASMREKERGRIGRREFCFGPGIGKVEDMHYLKAKGRTYLVEEWGRRPDEIKLPLGPTRFHQDYRHRKMTIESHMTLRQSSEKCGMTMRRCDHYFDGGRRPSGKGRVCATRLGLETGYFEADAITAVGKGKVSHLRCLEIHRGHRVVKIEQQWRRHARALSEGSASIKYNVPIGNRVLTVFEHKTTLLSTIERLQFDPLFRYLKKHFISISYDDLIKGSDLRTDLNGDPYKLFSHQKL